MSFLTKLPRDLYREDAFATFDGQAASFHPGTAKAMAWMCQLAYETDDPDKIRGIAENWGVDAPKQGIISEEIVTPLPKASTQVIVCERPDTIIIAFAGTDPPVLADWISDFDIGITKDGAANGFAVAALAAEAKIDERLAAIAPTKPIIVTGHSLGGALAALCAHRLAASHPGGVRAVYTFGMPRPGSSDFAATYNAALGARTYRLVHGSDAVATVAPSFLGFRHVGRLLRCASRTKFNASTLSSLDPPSDEPNFEKGISARLKNLLHGSLTDSLTSAQHKAIAAIFQGQRPEGVRTDPGGLIIELLPPPLRDHMPDRYIQAAS